MNHKRRSRRPSLTLGPFGAFGACPTGEFAGIGCPPAIGTRDSVRIDDKSEKMCCIHFRIDVPSKYIFTVSHKNAIFTNAYETIRNPFMHLNLTHCNIHCIFSVAIDTLVKRLLYMLDAITI